MSFGELASPFVNTKEVVDVEGNEVTLLIQAGEQKSAVGSRAATAGGLLLAAVGLLGYTATVSGTGPLARPAPSLAAHVKRTTQIRDAFLADDHAVMPGDVSSRLEAQHMAAENVDLASVGTDPLEISVTNSYTKTAPIQTGVTYRYPWSYVAEPYRTTTLAVKNADADTWYKWTVDGHVQGYGATCEVLFTQLGKKDIVLTAKTATSTTYLSAKVMVKYVRREIRSLTDFDREKFFDAVHVLARVPTEVGQALYGSNYKSKDYFNRVHLYYGGTADCDHWHQGAGFVTSHVTFTLEYEKAIQSVFPDSAVPYWDFTLESTFYRAEDWRTSPIFSSSWFGAASPQNDLHTVTEGRWAFETAMTNAQNFSKIHNSYGVLRAPWNADPTPFMTRHDHIYGYVNNMKPSGCKEYHTAMKKTTWMALSKQLNAAAHGHIHETMGGSWNHYYANRMGEAGGAAVLTFAHEIQALSKELWRTNFIKCPDTCDMATSWQDCQCEFNRHANGADLESYEILDQAGVLKSVEYYDAEQHLISKFYNETTGQVMYHLPKHSEEQSRVIFDTLLEMLSSPGHIGDMFQATSSNDITFWVLHGTVDRLWHFKRLGNAANYDETWDPYHTCYGHNPSHFQPFKNIFDNDDKYYTNEELYANLRPDKPQLPYMYDNFEWPHCEILGYDMSNEW